MPSGNAELLNWDDVRLFLAVMRASSARKASAELGVSRPTVTRRLTTMETRLGLELFERRADGLHPTQAAIDLMPAVEHAETAMLGVARAAQAANQQMRGPLRIAVPAIVAADLLMEDLVAFADQWPEIDLIFSGSYQVSDLAQREADVAIRFQPLGVPPDDTLAGRKVGNAYMAIYGEGDNWIGNRGEAKDRAWVERTKFPSLPIRHVVWDGEILRSACIKGMGLARMPCFMADERLRRRSKPEPGLDVWVLVHPDLKRNPRLRAFRDAMVDALRRLKPVLQGKVSARGAD